MRYEAGEMRDLSFISAELHDTSIARNNMTYHDILCHICDKRLRSTQRLTVQAHNLPPRIIQVNRDFLPLLKV